MANINDIYDNEIAALLLPTCVVAVTARAPHATDKVATIAWCMPISHTPSLIAVAIRPNGETSNAMVEGGCFVVNVLPQGYQDAAVICGKHVDDRFAEAGLTLTEAHKVKASRIEQAISWIECELVSHEVHGDHELFIGHTLSAQTENEVGEDGKLIPANPLVMGQRGCFGHFEKDE